MVGFKLKIIHALNNYVLKFTNKEKATMDIKKNKLKILIKKSLNTNLNEIPQPWEQKLLSHGLGDHPEAGLERNFPDVLSNVENSIYHIEKNRSKLKKIFSLNDRELIQLSVAAIGVTKRESDFGTGRIFRATEWLKTIDKETDAFARGPGQIHVYSHYLDKDGKEGYETNKRKKAVAKLIKLEKVADFDNYVKSVFAVFGILATNYKAAVKIYSTADSAVMIDDGKQMVSTGNAALDAAITAYNIGSRKIDKYCKRKDDSKYCIKCSSKKADKSKRVKNYIPNTVIYHWKTGKRLPLSTKGYLTEVAKFYNKNFDLITSMFREINWLKSVYSNITKDEKEQIQNFLKKQSKD